MLDTKERLTAQRAFETDRYIKSLHPVFYTSMRKDSGNTGIFTSEDAHAHECTVTGALWTPQGRKGDAVDDKIVSTFVEEIKTIIYIWTPLSTIDKASAAKGIMSFAFTSDINMYVGASTGSLTDETMTIQQTAGGAPRSGITDYTFIGNTAYHITWAWNGTNYIPYVNANPVTVEHSVGGVTLITTERFVIHNSDDGASPLAAIWGTVILLRDSLNLAEIQENYWAIKWGWR